MAAAAGVVVAVGRFGVVWKVWCVTVRAGK